MTNVNVNYYESLFELNDAIRKDVKNGIGYGRSSYEPAGEWNGGASLEQCAEMLLTGWRAKRKAIHQNIDEALRELEDRINSYITDQNRSVLDVSGGYVDVDRYLLGEPECMWESHMHDEVSSGKVLKVLVNVAACAGVPPERITERGMAVAAAVEAVQRMGFNVELWVGECVTGWGNRSGYDASVELVRVKDYRDVIDEEVSLFLMAHPGMLRKIIFWCNEQNPKVIRRDFGFGPDGSGYGRPARFPAEVSEQYDLVVETGQSFTVEEIVDQLVVTKQEDRLNEYA